jgi:PAS domain S-box-containing protein
MTNILIVEDESIVAWDIKETLEKLGHQVVDLVVSGAEAIRAATTSHPDLVLMDIRLAGEIDGITAGAEIYERLNIPVVYLTAHADERTLDRATQSNPFGYIIKPFRSQTLQSTIQIACQRHQQEASVRQSQTDLANTLNSIGNGTIVTDRLGVVTFINPIAQELTGWDATEALGKQIGEVFRLHGKADSIAIENPSLRAMRLKQPVKSPEGCWLTTKDRSQIPVFDTATPIHNSDGEVVGSVVVFHNNIERMSVQQDLQERNQDLEDFQSKLISQLQTKTAEYQQAIACTQLVELILDKVHSVQTETELIYSVLQQFGTAFDADYCWYTLHDVRGTTARIVSEYISTDRQMSPPSQVGQQIDIRLYPEFYNHLFENESWIDPPREIIPTPYLALWEPAAQMLICPTLSDPPGAADPAERSEMAIGEVGIVTTGKPPWTACQSQLIGQILSYAVTFFRQRHCESVEQESISRSLTWLNSLKDEFRISLIDVNRAMHISAQILQKQILQIDVKTANSALIEQHRSSHRKLALNLQLLQAEWQRQFQLIDILIHIQAHGNTSKIQSLSNVQFERWIAEIIKRCTTIAQRYQQEISGEIPKRLPPNLSYPFTIIELIVIELFENACKYTPYQYPIILEVDVDDRQLQLSIVSAGIELPPRELELIFLPFARDAQEFAATSGITGLGLSIVNKLVPLMGCTIQATIDRNATRLILTVPVC